MTGTRRVAVAFAAAAALSGAGTLSVAGAARYLNHRPPSREAADVFGVLRAERSVRDDIPMAGTEHIRNDAATRKEGVRWGESRLATTVRGVTVYLVPTRIGVCLLLSGPEIGNALGCATTENAAAGHLISRIVLDGSTVAFGVARDGVREVTLSTDVTTSAVVTNNAYGLTAGAAGGTLSWTGAGGGSVDLPPSML